MDSQPSAVTKMKAQIQEEEVSYQGPDQMVAFRRFRIQCFKQLCVNVCHSLRFLDIKLVDVQVLFIIK